MIGLREKANYFLVSLAKSVSSWQSLCPHCKTDVKNGRVIDKKYLVTNLIECPNCKILVRTPTDTASASNEFYQSAYSQEYTTDCPPTEELAKLIQSNFGGSDRDYSRYIRFFRFLGVPDNARVLDFGCSWGYGLHQLTKAGYQAEGYEVSRPRANYGRDKMGLQIHSSFQDLKGEYDVIFSSHVLEHLPDFDEINQLYRNNLRPSGRFVAVTPNGSDDFKTEDFVAYHQLWGKVHPVLLTDEFVKHNYRDALTYLDSWNSADPEFVTAGTANRRLDKFELVFVLNPPK